MKYKFDYKSFVEHLPEELAESVSKAVAESEVSIDDLQVKRMGQAIDMKMADGEERTFTGYASTRELDRDDEIVVPNGVDLSHYKMAPVILWGHNWSELPIGSGKEIASDGYGLMAKGQLAEYPFADSVWNLVQGGHLKTSSIGFVPMAYVVQGTKEFGALADKLDKNWAEFSFKTADKTKAIITKSLLLEWSLVSVPANIQSLIDDVSSKSAKRFGIDIKELKTPPTPPNSAHPGGLLAVKESKPGGFALYRKSREVPGSTAGFRLVSSESVKQSVIDAIEISRGKV